MVAEFPALFIKSAAPALCYPHENLHLENAGGLDGGPNVPWFDELSHGEESAEKDTETADDDVRDAEEGVPTAHDCARREQDGFGAVVDVDRKV